MKIRFKKQMIYWANIILLTVNITFFVFFFSSGEEKIRENKNNFSNEFMAKELGFSDGQSEKMAKADEEVQYKYQIILKLLCQNRYRLLNELAKPYPSETEMENIAELTGFLHRALKVQTIEHLMNIKKICTAEQTGRLNNFFMEILEMEHYCPLCKEKCSVNKKRERYPVFFPYDHEAEKRMREQLNVSQ